jgi:hypothetical protein
MSPRNPPSRKKAKTPSAASRLPDVSDEAQTRPVRPELELLHDAD